jgi:hypothetical protein
MLNEWVRRCMWRSDVKRKDPIGCVGAQARRDGKIGLEVEVTVASAPSMHVAEFENTC